MAKAMVLPEPVRLPPTQSHPSKIFGMQARWMGVGLVMAMDVNDATSHGCTLSDAKLRSAVVVVGGRRAAADVDIFGWILGAPAASGPLDREVACLAGGDNLLRFRVRSKARPSSTTSERDGFDSSDEEHDDERERT